MRFFTKDKIFIYFTFIYFSVGLIEIFAEFFANKTLILSTKPLLMPLLIVLYCLKSNKINFMVILALSINFVANILFAFQQFNYDFTANFFLILTKIIFIYLIINCKFKKNIFPMLVGCIPFVSMYLFIIQMSINEMKNGLSIFISQAVFMAIFGGVSLSNYILNPNKANTHLLICGILFAFSQFTFPLRLLYDEINIFQPMAMVLFIIAQYLFIKGIIRKEKTENQYNL